MFILECSQAKPILHPSGEWTALWLSSREKKVVKIFAALPQNFSIHHEERGLHVRQVEQLEMWI
jgi:hypothetical protein